MVIEEPQAPQACTLSPVDWSVRTAEFDALFADAVTGVDRLGPTRLRLTLSGGPDLQDRVRDLTARETECCSFFTFTLTPRATGVLELDVAVPVSQLAVLDGVASRAADAQAPA